VVLTVYAAGSLRAALTGIARDFEAAPTGTPVRLVFGAAGLLRTRLEAGEHADVYASANLEHPQALAAAGRAGAVQCFARNRLCLLAAPGFTLGRATLVERLLDPAVRVGTSTPGADPSGDYALALFDRIEAAGAGAPGTAATLKAKALRLTGAAGLPRPPLAGNVYGAIVAAGWADAFVTYRTNAAIACRERPELQVLEIPPALNVTAAYGLTVLRSAAPAADRFVHHVLSAAGQARLHALGFAPP
jgi:ABC-type molybdate transport system substrate-binding protein